MIILCQDAKRPRSRFRKSTSEIEFACGLNGSMLFPLTTNYLKLV